MTEIITATSEHIDFIAQSQQAMAKETENYELPLETLLKGVRHIIEHPEKGFYLIALREGKPAACMLVLYEWSDWRNGEVLWIHSLFVLPKFRRSGIFTLFYDFLKNKVEESSTFRGIRLYVEKNNTTAQAAYRKVGMTDEHYDLFEWLK